MLEIYRLLLVSVVAWSALAQMDTNTETKKHRNLQSKNICTPPRHRKSAERVLKNMKHEIEPCDDFYQFACGNYIETVQIPEGKSGIDPITDNSDTFVEQITKIVTEERAETDPSHFKLPNQFFKSCMNTTLIDSLVDEPIKEISNSLGGWPVVVGDSWDSNNSWSWQDLAQKLRRLGFNTNYLITFTVENDVRNYERNIIYLYKPNFVFESKSDDTSMEKYYDFMVDAAISFGANKRAAIRELRKSLNFEMELIEISEIDNNLNDLGNILSIEQLQERYPYIQWLDFINALLPENFTIDANITICVLVPNFLDELGTLLQRTEKRTIVNYIMWKFHYFSMNFLSKRFHNKRQQFDSRFLGKQLQEVRAMECLSLVSESLKILVSSMHANKYVNQISKSIVTKIFLNIRNIFGQTLLESEWLDEETKVDAWRKLLSMEAIIGFPDEVFDVGRIEEYYRELEIDENKYFQSFLNIRTFELDKEFRALEMPANESQWSKDVIISSGGPYNELSINVIYIPASFLQGQIFNTQRPNYLNYGSVGSAIAHEIIHGFCGDGCKYCPDGKEREWWQPASMQALTEREKCFIEQYNNYTNKQTGLKINGLRTLEENIADNSGTKLSYLAYKQWQATHDEEPSLPGLKYTPQQLFWISFAQTLCGKYTSDSVEKKINSSIHSPNEFRVLGVLRNLKDFSKDFHCPENSPMNPEKKCEFW